MADGFTFELVSPEMLLVSGEAEIVSIPGAEGDMGVLANHAPVMTSLRPGLVNAKMADGAEQSYFVRGGFADVTQETLTVLAEFAVPQAEMTREIFAEQQKLAQEEFDKHHAAGNAEAAANARSYLEQLNHLEPVLLPV